MKTVIIYIYIPITIGCISKKTHAVSLSFLHQFTSIQRGYSVIVLFL